MARWMDWTSEQQAAFDEWLSDRPTEIRALAQRFPPHTLYWLDPPGHRVYVIGYNEDGTLRVVVDGQFNLVTFSREVFGVNPDDLTECDLPGDGDPVGEICQTADEVELAIAAFRELKPE